MTFNEDQLKAYIQQTAWEVGNEICERLESDLSGMAGSDLSGSDLSGAKLSGADLSGADLSRSNGIDPNRCTPLRILLDQPGKIRAYKLVNSKMEGPFNGGLKYTIGKALSAKCNMDINEQCGSGVNLATLDWCMREWRAGYRILIAEFTAKTKAGNPNICVPTSTDGKFRVAECKIVGEKDLVELGLVTKG